MPRGTATTWRVGTAYEPREDHVACRQSFMKYGSTVVAPCTDWAGPATSCLRAVQEPMSPGVSAGEISRTALSESDRQPQPYLPGALFPCELVKHCRPSWMDISECCHVVHAVLDHDPCGVSVRSGDRYLHIPLSTLSCSATASGVMNGGSQSLTADRPPRARSSSSSVTSADLFSSAQRVSMCIGLFLSSDPPTAS